MTADRAGGNIVLPYSFMHSDMGGAAADLTDMLAVTLIAAFVAPGIADPFFGAAENRSKVIVQTDVRVVVPFQFIDTNLGNVGPYAQHVGEIGNIDRSMGGHWL